MSNTTQQHTDKPVFFAKQPIMDAERRIWGYELLGGELQRGISSVFPKQQNTPTGLAYSAYYRLQGDIARGKRLMVLFDAENILLGIPRTLPAQSGAIRVTQEATKTPGVLAELATLKEEGYIIAVDCAHTLRPHKDALLLADVVCIDFNVKAAAIACRRGDTDSLMLARGIQTVDMLNDARAMGIELCQGPFFKSPEIIAGRELSSHESARIELMAILESPDPDLKGVAEAVKADVSLTFRLLSLLNSVAFGFRQKIDSVDHAVALLGWNQIRSWLRAVLVADMASQSEGSQELALISMQRARFLEQLATHYDYWGFNPESLFLMGMLSLLDAILGLPMTDVLDMLPLQAKFKECLQGAPDNEHAPLFALVSALEDADWDRLNEMMLRLGFTPNVVKTLYTEAMDWAASCFGQQEHAVRR